MYSSSASHSLRAVAPNDPDRLAALRRYNVLDTLPEPAYDHVADLVADHFEVPIALVSFIDADRQWFKACKGLDLKETTLDDAFCIHTVQTPDVMVVEDATDDPRFAENPFVAGEPGLRFYAGVPLITDDDYPVGTLCVMDTKPRQISERKKVQLRKYARLVMDELEFRREVEQRRQVETRWRRLVEGHPGPIYITIDGCFQYLNPSAVRFFGVTSQKELLGRSVFEFMEPDVREEMQARKEQLEAGRPTAPVEYRMQRDDGTWRTVVTQSVPVTHGGQPAAQTVLQDVTDRKRNEEELRRNKERFQAVSDQAIDVIAIVDHQANFQYLSASFEDVTGLGSEAMLGENAFARVHPDDVAAGTSAFERAITNPDTTVDVELRYEHASGDWRHLQVKAKRLHTAQDAPEMLINVRDVTEQKRYEEKLVAAKEKAEEMNRLKSAFLANMSHEIRTPLTSIIGFTDVLNDMDLEEQARHFIRLVHRSGERLLETLNSVLDLSQLEAGSVQLHPEAVRVVMEARSVVESFDQRAAAKGVDIQIETPSDPVTIVTDCSALQRVITNLVSNAIKFTDRGGTVTLRVWKGAACAADQFAANGRRTPDNSLGLEVSDTGVGIDEAFLPHLFDAFKQESTGNARQYEGNGLGLTITKQLVDLMQGTIAVKSAKGDGATFTVLLPPTLSPGVNGSA